MKSHTEYLVFETRKRREMVHITDQVEQIVKRSGVQDGLCFVSPMHITAAVYVNDHESGLIEDIGKWLEELAPARPDYKHHQTGEDNGDAHLKSLLLHHETTLPVTGGKLDLGTWQQVFYAEFDGQRRKRVIVKVLGGGVRGWSEVCSGVNMAGGVRRLTIDIRLRFSSWNWPPGAGMRASRTTVSAQMQP